MGSIFSKPSIQYLDPVPPGGEPVYTGDPNYEVSNQLFNIVFCYGYVGTGYNGLQLNKNFPTLERDLLQAFMNSHLLPQDVYLRKAAYNWMTASRTDTGVHAAAQVTSTRICGDFSTEEIEKRIRENLPEGSHITIWKVIKLGKRFDPQRYAHFRQYRYLLPLSALGNQSMEHLNYLRENLFPKFVGNINFHNYTRQYRPDDKGAIKTMTEFSCTDPFMLNGKPWLVFKLRGSSFLLNQIRKMMAVVITVSQGYLTLEEVDRTLTEELWDLNKLPGVGLFLHQIEYTDAFTQKFDANFTEVRPDIDKWEKEVLFPHIAYLAETKNIFENWIENVMKVYKCEPHVEKERHEGRAQKVQEDQ